MIRRSEKEVKLSPLEKLTIKTENETVDFWYDKFDVRIRIIRGDIALEATINDLLKFVHNEVSNKQNIN